MTDLNLTALRRVAEGVLAHSPRRAGKTTRAERFCLAASPATVLALIDRLEAAEAKVERGREVCAKAWFTGEVHRDDITDALAGDPNE